MHEPITPFSPRVVEKECVSDTDQAPTTKKIKAAAYSSYSNGNIMVLVSCSCNSIIQNWGLLICMSECWTVLRGKKIRVLNTVLIKQCQHMSTFLNSLSSKTVASQLQVLTH